MANGAIVVDKFLEHVRTCVYMVVYAIVCTHRIYDYKWFVVVFAFAEGRGRSSKPRAGKEKFEEEKTCGHHRGV